jgi:hypothetical protein
LKDINMDGEWVGVTMPIASFVRCGFQHHHPMANGRLTQAIGVMVAY